MNKEQLMEEWVAAGPWVPVEKGTHINIPNIKSDVETYINKIQDMLNGEIRVIGLREKLEKRITTLMKVDKILSKHSE